MKRLGFFVLALLAFALCVRTARAQEASERDGKIIEQAAYALPTYDQIPERFRQVYTREAVDGMKGASQYELLKIKYMSGGLKVTGFIYKPKKTEGKKFPAVIWNRGGIGEDTRISVENFNDFYEMHRYVSEGFVVLASQYRGTDGSEGKDEMGGGDTDDVVNLIPLASSLGYVDMDKIFMWGFSRGALMTLQAIRRGVPIRAAVIVGAPTDLAISLQDNPAILQFARANWPGFETRREEHVRNRSAVQWADQINIPLLILHGGADPAISPREAVELAQKLSEAGKLYELTIYAKDDHEISLNAEDRMRRTIDWFKNVRTIPISQPLRKTIGEQGVEAAIKQYYELKKDQPQHYDFREAELNSLGYRLLFTGRVKEAIEIFKLNVAAYPRAFNTYDSLGEAYLANNERELAIKNYKKSLELNPQNTNAIEVLKKLGQQ